MIRCYLVMLDLSWSILNCYLNKVKDNSEICSPYLFCALFEHADVFWPDFILVYRIVLVYKLHSAVWLCAPARASSKCLFLQSTLSSRHSSIFLHRCAPRFLSHLIVCLEYFVILFFVCYLVFSVFLSCPSWLVSCVPSFGQTSGNLTLSTSHTLIDFFADSSNCLWKSPLCVMWYCSRVRLIGVLKVSRCLVRIGELALFDFWWWLLHQVVILLICTQHSFF